MNLLDGHRKQEIDGAADRQRVAREIDHHWPDDMDVDDLGGWSLIGLLIWTLLAGSIGYALWLTWGQ